MVVDGVLGFVVIWKLWHWRWWQAGLLIGPLVIVDAIYFSADLLKIFEGAWLPLLFGIAMVLLIITWRRGTDIVAGKTRGSEVNLETLVRSLERKPPHIVPGTAVFLTSDPNYAPTALMHNLKHNKILHEHNVILTIITTDTPRVAETDRVTIIQVSPRFSRIALKFGYVEIPNVPKALALARKKGWTFDICRRRFSCPGARCALQQNQACRDGRTDYSSVLHAARATPRTSFKFRPAGWSRWAHRSRFDIERNRILAIGGRRFSGTPH